MGGGAHSCAAGVDVLNDGNGLNNMNDGCRGRAAVGAAVAVAVGSTSAIAAAAAAAGIDKRIAVVGLALMQPLVVVVRTNVVVVIILVVRRINFVSGLKE